LYDAGGLRFAHNHGLSYNWFYGVCLQTKRWRTDCLTTKWRQLCWLSSPALRFSLSLYSSDTSFSGSTLPVSWMLFYCRL